MDEWEKEKLKAKKQMHIPEENHKHCVNQNHKMSTVSWQKKTRHRDSK